MVVTLKKKITFLVSMQISISSLQTHNVNICGRSRHLARKLSLRRKLSSPTGFEMAASDRITSIIVIKLITVSIGTVRHARRCKIVVIDIQITLKQMLRDFIGIKVNRAKKSGIVFQAEDGIRHLTVTGVQTCALPISRSRARIQFFTVHPPHSVRPGTPAWEPDHPRCRATPAAARRRWRFSSSPRALRAAYPARGPAGDRKSTRLNSSHSQISYAVFCLKKKKRHQISNA